MNPFVLKFLLLSCLGLSLGCMGETYTLGDRTQLAALDRAQPGDVFLLKSGVWKDVHFNINHGGTASQIVTLKAERPGQVMLTGSSFLAINAPYVSVEGFLFKDGSINKGAVIAMNSDHAVVSQMAVIDYNPQGMSTQYPWVVFNGSYNQLSSSYFKGKSNAGAVVINAEFNSRHNTLTNSFFQDMPLKAHSNGREIIKILGGGHVDAQSPDGAYFTLEGNLFDHADGEGVEIISIKSNHNWIQNNTIVQSVGSLNVRRGSDNSVKNNVILCQDRKDAQGIRMSGARNWIEANYVSHCEYGVALSSGEYWEQALTPHYKINDRGNTAPNKARYPQNQWVTIFNNVLVSNKGADLDVGSREYKKHWPAHQNVLIPESCTVSHNTVYRPQGGASVIGVSVDTQAPLDQLHFEPNVFEGNVLLGGRNTLASMTGFEERPFPKDWLEHEVLNGFKPLKASDVGPDWLNRQ